MNGRHLATLDNDSDYHSEHRMAFSPEGRELATSGGKNSEIRVWNPATGAQLRKFLSGLSHVWSLAYSPNGKLLAAGGVGTVKIFDVTGGQKGTFTGSFRGSERIVWTPDGSNIIVGTEDATIVSFNLDSQREAWTVALKGSKRIRGMALDRTGTLLAVGTEEERLELWDVTTRTKKAEIPGMSSPVYSLAWHPSAPVLAAARGAIQLVRKDGAALVLRSFDMPQKSACLAYAPSGLFSGDSAAFAGLRYRDGVDLVKSPLLRAAQVKNTFYRPNLLEEFLAGCPMEN